MRGSTLILAAMTFLIGAALAESVFTLERLPLPGNRDALKLVVREIEHRVLESLR